MVYNKHLTFVLFVPLGYTFDIANTYNHNNILPSLNEILFNSSHKMNITGFWFSFCFYFASFALERGI